MHAYELRSTPDRARNQASLSPAYHHWLLKRWGERLLAVIGLLVLSPLLLLLAAVVRWTSPGKAFYWQERSGLHGRTFQILKLRTMFQDAEQWTGAVWAMEDDPRITLVGKILRKLHLDELPQLWNIAKGEMTLVGPRPERPSIIEELTQEIPGYRWRLAVLPGVTGLAQVNLPPDQTFDCVRRKLELDLEYVFTAEPWMDIRIVACTLLKMMAMPPDWATRLLGLYRDPDEGVPFQPTAEFGSNTVAHLPVADTASHNRTAETEAAAVRPATLSHLSESLERPRSMMPSGR